MIQTNRKGCKELLTQRMFLAIVSSIAVQYMFVSVTILIMNASLDCVSWIQDTWSAVTSFRMWAYFVVLASIAFVQGTICSKKYLSAPTYLKSRFSKLRGMFTTQNTLLAVVYVTIGGALSWLHLSLKTQQNGPLISVCSNGNASCLVEEHFFLLFGGFWSGLHYFVASIFLNTSYLKFPIVPLPKFFQAKRQIFGMLPSLMVASLWPSLHFMVGYYFVGSYCRAAILSFTSAHIETETLDSLPRLLSLSLFFHLWLYQLIFMLTINSMYLLFEIYLTEWVPFEFRENNIFETNNNGVTLSEALSMDTVPIMQHLGYLDLVILAQKDTIRRSALFMLSQPGGHPYNWNCVVERCLNLIKKFAADLNEVSIKPLEQKSTACFQAAKPIFSNVSAFQQQHTYHMRSLVSEKDKTIPAEATGAKLNHELGVSKFVKTKWQNFVTYLLSKPLINYVFGEQVDNKVQYVLFNNQPIIWAAEAISSLSVRSLTEDSYGIAQKDLPVIIESLLTLKQALDKLQKSYVLARKQQNDNKLIRQTFASLRSATKRSLYRIATNFEKYIVDLELEPLTIEQLQGFLNCKE